MKGGTDEGVQRLVLIREEQIEHYEHRVLVLSHENLIVLNYPQPVFYAVHLVKCVHPG